MHRSLFAFTFCFSSKSISLLSACLLSDAIFCFRSLNRMGTNSSKDKDGEVQPSRDHQSHSASSRETSPPLSHATFYNQNEFLGFYQPPVISRSAFHHKASLKKTLDKQESTEEMQSGSEKNKTPTGHGNMISPLISIHVPSDI